MRDRLTASLQESVLTLLCFDKKFGAIAAGILDPNQHFEHPYSDIAARAIEYRHKYGKPPGQAHIDDLFDHVLSDPDNRLRRLYERVLGGLLEQSKSLNAEYVAQRISGFAKRQRIKAALIEAGQRIQQSDDEEATTEVENIMQAALKMPTASFEAGTFLGNSARALSFLDHAADTYKLGIPELDHFQICPTLGELLLFLAPKGRGKTWFATHCGRQAWMQRGNVVHVSLEMRERYLAQRYLQMLFAVAKRDEPYTKTTFQFDELRRLIGFKRREFSPKLFLTDNGIRRILREKIDEWGARLDRLVIKDFPTNSLTVPKLEAYLDSLELTHKFVPSMLIIDYPELMALGGGDHLRESIGRTYIALRGLCQQRNLALVCPSQVNRSGLKAKQVDTDMSSEDITKVFTADNALTYSQTKMEYELGLARLFVANARNDRDRFTVLISQNYDVGQFCVSSASMPGENRYWDLVNEELGGPRNEDAE